MTSLRIPAYALAAAFFLSPGPLPAANHQAAGKPPLVIATDPTWEVSGFTTQFGEYPLSAEQIASATSRLYGGSQTPVPADYSRESKIVPGTVPIWRNAQAKADAGESYHFRKTVPVGAESIRKATLEINCDDVARVYINKRLASVEGRDGTLKDGSNDWFTFRSLSGFTARRIYTYDVTDYLFSNIVNTIFIEVASLDFSGSHAYVSAKLTIEFEPEPPRPASAQAPSKAKPASKPKVKTPAPKPAATKPAAAEKAVFEAGRDPELASLRVGAVLELGHVYFKADDYRLDTASYRTLAALASFLKRHPSLKIEVGGHTNLRPNYRAAYELSQNRARSVMRYLTDNGVPADRVTHKGYGKTQPRVPAISKEADRANQRVEIKVLEK